VRPLDPLFIRIGKRLNFDSELFTFGIGLSWENIAFDVAIVPTAIEGDYGSKWLMGLRYSIPQKKDKAGKKTTVIHPDTTAVVPLPDTLKPVIHESGDSVTQQHRDTIINAVLDSTKATTLSDTIVHAIPENDSAADTTPATGTMKNTGNSSVITSKTVTLPVSPDSGSTLPTLPVITDKKPDGPSPTLENSGLPVNSNPVIETTGPSDSTEKSPPGNR
jgi:hypothetical protein